MALEAPATFSAEQTADGFIFTAADSATRRSPTEIVAEFRDGTAPAGDWSERRRINSRTASYCIDIEEGAGLGRDIHALHAWESAGNGYVWIEQEIQVEAPTEPDFTTAWRILESASMKSK